MAPLSSDAIETMAREAGFDLVGFARAEPIPPEHLGTWLAAGMDADMDWLSARAADRLDVTRLLPGARTVVSLACNYHRAESATARSPISRYARGRDYHYTLRDRLRALRRSLTAAHPGLPNYASVDTGPVMEKVWAVRAGLGHVGKNGLLITEKYGSWVMLATMILAADVDRYAGAALPDRCGTCHLCVLSCPTDALVEGRYVDARRCLSYQTIENEGPFPEALRSKVSGWAFGCDICQTVCPLNRHPVATDNARFAPRPVAELDARALAALTPERYQELVAGTPLGRAKYDGLRRNAVYVLGAARDGQAAELLRRLSDDPSELVRSAAQWALQQLPSTPRTQSGPAPAPSSPSG